MFAMGKAPPFTFPLHILCFDERFQKYLFGNLLLFTRGEGDQATSPSFVTRCAPMEASSVSLEALIASLLPSGGTTK